MPISTKVEDSSLEPIAIVGMACRLPGAVDSASSLWDLLVKKGSGQTPKVPKSRFNIDAHYHENIERPGSFNVLGGYFLDGLLEDFDPTFFNITPIEAMWMDPQQRKMLEVSYECLESAGLSLDSVAGSNTAVFVGSFTSDYQQMSIKDPDFRHNYAATGVDPGIISNRIGNALNLAGPSFTINTACSSSIYAIHNACHALRERDCEAAIAGGVNLILTVDQHMNTAKLGILSPTSTCHTFDASADGYGRAEGAGALYLKRLSDAIRDGDPVRGVIRSSAVNTNGRVPGMGITHPSVAGQERVVRAAYERANLDPARTAYLECHGTGTPVGDPIEVSAVSRAMNDTRAIGNPLLVGAIKANIGHSEAASGIFAVMKAAMMTENGVIPGVAGLKNLNPAILESDWNVKVNVDTKAWPSDGLARRASVSSFGYGGTNGHVIVEEVTSLYPWYHHGKSKAEAPYDHSVTQPLLVTLSAHDKTTLSRNIDAHAKIASQFYLADLAYTLNMKRTKLPQRAFSVVREGQEPTDFEQAAFKFGVAAKREPDLAFVFTGQGAQWAGMGVEAMQVFPSFLRTIKALDRVLSRLPTPSPWTLESAILASAETSKINDAEIAQPVITALQIAIVDLLTLWQVRPTVTVGHSSGEIGAAYAAGLLSAPEAIIAAYYRGYAVKKHAPVGSMLAAALGAQDISGYIVDLGSEAVIACENSPSSVTLSGSESGIQKVKSRLDADEIFCRELPTGKAYHSPQMDAVAPIYNGLLVKAISRLDHYSMEWRQPRTRWISSVTGSEFDGDEVPAAYWSQNMRSRVLFDQAITTVGNSSESEDIRCFVEIGPHSALAGPLKQIWKANHFDRYTYISTLVRKSDSSHALLETAGNLWVHNHSVDLEAVNAVERLPQGRSPPKALSPLVLVDLPPYQWNYSKVFWTEPRFSHEQRSIQYARHDILGSRVVGLSDRSLVWRNILRHKDLPWLKDHKLGNAAVFPAAGHLSLAIEAVRQVCETDGIGLKGARFRDVAIKTALVIPEAEDGIEVHFRLHLINKDQASSTWYSFAVESITDNRWTTHCEGTIKALLESSTHSSMANAPVDISRLTQHVPSKRWYNAFNRVGFEYGPSFQKLGPIQTDSKSHEAAATVEIETESQLMKGESRYILHPSTIDACLQLIIISINAGLHKEMTYGVVPVNIEQLSLWFPGDEVGTVGNAVAWTDEHVGRHFNTHTKLLTEEGNMILDITSLRCVAYEAAVPQQTIAVRSKEPYMQTVWKPDIETLKSSESTLTSVTGEPIWNQVAEVVELIHHRKTLERAIFIDCSEESLQSILPHLPSQTWVTIFARSAETLETLQSLFEGNFRITIRVLDGSSVGSVEPPLEAQDVAFISDTSVEWDYAELLSSIKALLVGSGRLLTLTDLNGIDLMEKNVIAAGFSAAELQFSSAKVRVSCYSSSPDLDGFVATAETVALITLDRESSQSLELAASLSDQDHAVEVVDLVGFSSHKDQKIVIHDTEGLILSSLVPESFEALRKVLLSGASMLWLTSGVNEGEKILGAMAQGFLRAVRSEQASLKITLLDVDINSDPKDISSAVMSKLKIAATKDSGADTEFWLHNGALEISRISPNLALNERFGGNRKPAENAPLAAGKALHGGMVDGELVLSQDVLLEQKDLGADDVEVQVTATELDVPQEGHPRIVAGRVVKVGSKADPTMMGQEIVTFAADPYSTIVRTPISVTAPVAPGFTAAGLVASLPQISKVWNSIVGASKAQPGDYVLLLPARLEIISLMAAFVANMGVKLAVVVRSEEEREELATRKIEVESLMLASNRESIDGLLSSHGDCRPNIVIAYDFSSLSQNVWRIMPAMGRFILCDAVIDVAPDVLPFSRGATFISTGIASLFKQDLTALGNVLTSSVDVLARFKDILLNEASKSTVSSLEDSAHIAGLKSDGNTVITYDYEKDNVKTQPTSAGLRLAPEATYLLVGCLGGLGRSLTTWMMDRGATSFAFISRSGADKPEAARVIESIKKAGFDAQVYRADASDSKEVTKVVHAISINRPIRGVVHAAMVLQDAMYERMTHSQFMAAVVPKVRGAQCLHEALADAPLDFFVMTSSISATLGNPGQANYCAANSFLDALAWHRNLQGLPAVSLVLPMILDVGVVSENEDIETSLARKAMYGIDEGEMLGAFETAMMQPTPSPATAISGNAQIILGLEPARLAAALSADNAADAYWLSDARLANLCATVKAIQGAGSGSGGRSESDFATQLKSARAEGPEVAIQAIASHIMQRCSRILMVALEDFSLDEQSIADYGLDSMIGAELRNWLFKEFELDISFQDLLAPSVTFHKLALIVAAKIGVLPDDSAEN